MKRDLLYMCKPSGSTKKWGILNIRFDYDWAYFT